MARRNRYREMEYQLTRILIADVIVFVLYLVFAGAGIVWLKVITAIFAILMPVLCLGFLYMSKELLKQRSLWMSVGFAGIFISTAVSLITRFP